MSSQDAGFPPGITAGDLGRRVVAYVIDAALPVVLSAGAVTAVTLVPRLDLRIVLGIVAGLLSLGWLVVLWWSQGTRGASPGMKLMKLEVVAVENGRPVGWGRAIIRSLVFLGLSLTSVGLIVMVVMLVMHPRRQGWHDLVSRAVVINAREQQQPAVDLPGAGQRQGTARSGVGTVGLPAAFGGPGAGPSDGAGQAQPSQQPYGQQGYPQQAYGGQSGPAGQPGGGMDPAGGGPVEPGGPATATTPGQGGYGASSNPFFRDGVPDDGESVESTRLVQRAGPQRRPDQGWSIVLGDGRQVPVESLVLIGRNPQPRPGEEGAEMVSVSDSSRTVSKTHIAVGVDSRGIYVMDRGSTNGSAIATSSGAFEPCAAGDLVRVREGQVVSFGEQRFEVRRTFTTSPTS